MKNTQKHIGGRTVKVPELVMKLGLVYDSYKQPMRDGLWAAAEKKAKDMMAPFPLGPFFFEEIKPEGKLTYEFRYYTPESNLED
jgi:hypothetical protein